MLAVGALHARGVRDDARDRGKKTRAKHEAVYRCRDAGGQPHFGQSIPAVCMGRDIEVLDNTGRVVRRIDNAAVVALRAEQEQLEAARERAVQLAAQRDRTLLATYLSVTDIERLRDNRLEILVLQSQVTREYIANLRERETRLIHDVQRFPSLQREGERARRSRITWPRRWSTP